MVIWLLFKNFFWWLQCLTLKIMANIITTCIYLYFSSCNKKAMTKSIICERTLTCFAHRHIKVTRVTTSVWLQEVVRVATGAGRTPSVYPENANARTAIMETRWWRALGVNIASDCSYWNLKTICPDILLSISIWTLYSP